jgi:hypothetical protein
MEMSAWKSGKYNGMNTVAADRKIPDGGGLTGSTYISTTERLMGKIPTAIRMFSGSTSSMELLQTSSDIDRHPEM